MLQESLTKELFSRYLIQLMATAMGYKVSLDEVDHGVDLTIKGVRKFISKDRTRYMNSGKALDVQNVWVRVSFSPLTSSLSMI
jgi:hypothetical protein